MTEGPMDIEQVVSILKLEYEAAENHFGSVIAEEQATALDFYEARPFGDEVEGRSQVVLPDVAEAVDYMTISVLRTFISGDRVVEFEATEEEGEEGADEATAAVDYSFRREQDGYRVLHDWLQSGLLEKYSAVKTHCVEEERVRRDTLLLDADQLGLLEVEPESIADNGDGTFAVTIKTEERRKRYVDTVIPSEEFRFSHRAKHEDDADYLAHVSVKTRSELVDMGFDVEQVYELDALDADFSDSRQYARDHDDQYWQNESSKALQEVLLCEEYARIDIDGDGIAERVKIFRVGDDILIDAETKKESIETVEESPFVVFSPFPRAHRMVGNSLADKAMDLQRIRSVVARQLNDGLYQSNMPRPLVDMGNCHESTLDDLLTPIAGAPIRYSGTPPMPYQTSFDVGASLSVLEHWTGERETRTGITRLNQGLDAETLNKTATGAALMQAQGQQIEEFIARNLAESLSRLFAKKYRLMKREGEAFRVKIEGAQQKYRTVDPSVWPDDIRVNIRVGLGTGRKEQRIQHLMMLQPIMDAGFQIGMVNKEHLFRYGSDLVKTLGLGQGDDYFVDPAQQPEEGPQPDPEMMRVEAEQEREDAKLLAKMKETEAMLTLKKMEADAQVELAREQHLMMLEQKREAAKLDTLLAKERLDNEMALARERMVSEMALAKERQDPDADIAYNRPGGDLDK